MAPFDNVTYDYYTDVLGRSVVPDEQTFDRYKLENELYVKRLFADGLIAEREENGIASAVCMMVEEDYQHAQLMEGAALIDTSESIGGYSHSVDTKAYDVAVEKNAQPVSALKYKWLSLFCDIHNGARLWT